MIFFKKEKEVNELIIKYINKVDESLSTALKTLDSYFKEDINEAKRLSRMVDKLEEQADLIRYDIRDILYAGAFMPLLREDIFKLIETVDEVCNAGEVCCDFFLEQRPEIPDELKPGFVIATHESFSISAPIKQAVLCFIMGEGPLEKAREYSKTIGRKESEVDKIEWDLTRKIFTSSLDLSRKIHLKDCLSTITAVSDRAEDAADRLRLVTIKSVY